MKKLRIYVDMDGVIADFEKAAKHPPLHRNFKFDTTKLMNAFLNGKL